MTPKNCGQRSGLADSQHGVNEIDINGLPKLPDELTRSIPGSAPQPRPGRTGFGRKAINLSINDNQF